MTLNVHTFINSFTVKATKTSNFVTALTTNLQISHLQLQINDSPIQLWISKKLQISVSYNKPRNCKKVQTQEATGYKPTIHQYVCIEQK